MGNLRILIDTNVFIPLEGEEEPNEALAAEVMRLAQQYGCAVPINRAAGRTGSKVRRFPRPQAHREHSATSILGRSDHHLLASSPAIGTRPRCRLERMVCRASIPNARRTRPLAQAPLLQRVPAVTML